MVEGFAVLGEGGDALNWALFDALPAHIAVLDSDGVILAVNAAWRDFGRDNGIAADFNWIGTDYLAACTAEARPVAEAIRAALAGEATDFRQIAPCHSPAAQRWFSTWVIPLRRAGAGRAVVCHENVSDIKAAEIAQVVARDAAEACADRVAKSERFFKAIADSLPGMVAYWDRDLRCHFANRSYLEWFGRSPETVVGGTMRELMGDALFALNEPHIRAVLAGQAQHFERILTKADGSVGITAVNYVPDTDSQGETLGFFVLVTDVTAIKESEGRAKDAEARMRAIFDNVLEGIITIDGHGLIVSANPATVSMFGYGLDELVGCNVKMLMPEPDRGRHDGYIARYQSTNETKVIGFGRELEGQAKDGRIFPMELSVTKLDLHGGRLFVGSIRDITERRRAQELLKSLASTDGLTNLANRRQFDERLAREFAAHSRSGGELSMILLDIDHFKAFNDTYGHVGGDDCLRRVAQLIGQTVPRVTDLAARYGGEEFACILPMTTLKMATQIAERIRTGIERLAIPHCQSSVAGHVTASLGVITTRCRPGGSAVDIVTLADEQLYRAKSGGRNQVRAESV